MNTKQLLVLGLMSFAIANNVVAMEEVPVETEMQRTMRERKEMMERRLEAQRKAEESVVAKAMPDKAEAEPAVEITSTANDNNAMPKIGPVEAPTSANSPEMQKEIVMPAKDKEEDTGPSDEEVRALFYTAKEDRLRTLETTNTSIFKFNELILRKQNEGILAREIADTLVSKQSEIQIQGRLEQNTAAREFIKEKYRGDAEFTPIINALNARSILLELELQLIDRPLDTEVWKQLNAVLEQLILENIENAQFAQSLTAEHTAYQEAHQMILAGHLHSGIAIIDDFEEIDRAANDQLLAQLINEQQQEQDRPGQIAQGEEAARRLEAQARAEQNRADLEAARRLEEELNPGNRGAPAPVPGPNDPDNNPGPGNPNEPKFDLMAFMQKPEFMQGVIAAAGLTAVSFVIYKIYNWFTQKAKTPLQKKKEALRKKRIAARSTRYTKASKR